MFEIYDEEMENLIKAHEAENNNLPDPPYILRNMKMKNQNISPDQREDCSGDNHPVCPEMRETGSNLSTSDKWMIYSCIAAFVIGMVFVWLAISEKITEKSLLTF